MVSSRRYAHRTCYEQREASKTQEEKDKEQLEKYIKQLFNEKVVNAKIRKQLDKYINEYEYTYSGILKSLIYFFDIKKNDVDKANGGIGIVPFVYAESKNYFYALWLAKVKNEGKNLDDYIPKEEEITITPPKRKVKKRKLFSFLD